MKNNRRIITYAILIIVAVSAMGYLLFYKTGKFSTVSVGDSNVTIELIFSPNPYDIDPLEDVTTYRYYGDIETYTVEVRAKATSDEHFLYCFSVSHDVYPYSIETEEQIYNVQEVRNEPGTWVSTGVKTIQNELGEHRFWIQISTSDRLTWTRKMFYITTLNVTDKPVQSVQDTTEENGDLEYGTVPLEPVGIILGVATIVYFIKKRKKMNKNDN